MKPTRRVTSATHQLTFSEMSQVLDSQPDLLTVRLARVLTFVTVPIDPTFDVGQGLREIKPRVVDGTQIIFDWRHLGLAHEYMGGEPDPMEPFVTERGGLVSLATPMNVFRVQGAITRWAQLRGVTVSITHTPPPPDSAARRLYDVLAIDQVARVLSGTEASKLDFGHAREFQSRYVSPIMLVDGRSKRTAIDHVARWIGAVQQTGHLHFDLLRLLPEVVTNLVNHGLSGSLLLCIWPLGQVELLWSNRIRPGDAIFSGGSARDAASRIFHAPTGSGLSFILDELLPRYSGTLCINFKGADIMFHAGKRVELYHPSRRDDHFIPDSVLFTLQLFSVDAQRKGR